MTDEQRLQAFEARIASGEKIESDDWMPDLYRKQALRLILTHASSELMGALPEREWIPCAPGMHRKLAVLAKVQDEIGHAQLIYRVAEDLARPLGLTRDDFMKDLIAGRAKFHNVFSYPAPTWADVGVIAWLVDGAALVTQGALLRTSYGPYGRILRRICAEEAIHLKHGEDIVLTLAGGTKAQRQMLQDALSRWWEPLLHFFGPPDEVSPNTEQMVRWGIRLKSNEAMRQEFLQNYAPKILEIGLLVPDPALEKDPESGVWHYTQPDWDVFWKVVRGEGPKTKERLSLRRLAYEDQAWIRQAVQGAHHVA